MIRQPACVVAFFCIQALAASLPALDTIYTSPPLTAVQRERLLRNLDRRWENFQKKPPNMGVRDLFSFALESAEAEYCLERIAGALGIAEEMQDRDPASRTYGNFRWYWKSERPEDLNAVQFTMQDAVLLWMRHRDRIPAPARELLERLIGFSIEGIRRHRVSESYTNIFLMKTWNCIALGENTGRPELAREGYAFFDAWLLYTWENGIHEYISPTYYGTDLDSLVLINRFAREERARKQAEAALRYLWTDIAANWFEPGKRLGGSHSRDYDYVTGHGYVENHLWPVGWLEAQPEWIPLRFAKLAQWQPPAELRKLCVETAPRMVRQRWGGLPGQRSANWVGRSICLGTAGAAYGGAMDKPLSVVFSGGPQMAMVNFFMDARNDPYGRNREDTGGGHMKAFHVVSFIMSAQRERDALLLSTTSPQDADFQRYTKNPTCLFSQVVLPRDGVSVWVGDSESRLTKDTGSEPVRLDQPVFVRCGDAAAGFRVVYATDLDGAAAPIELRNDGNKFGAMTLTVIHSSMKPEKGRGTVAVRARVGEGLDEAGFAKFRREFAEAQGKVVYETPVLDVAAGGLRLRADLEKQERLECEGEEANAADFLLAVDGKELGREIFKDVEPISSYVRATTSLDLERAMVPESPFEIENAVLILSPFQIGEDPAAAGGKFVWMPGEPGEAGGSLNARALIPVRIVVAGAYYIWARIQTPTPSDDSFFFRIRHGTDEILPRSDWHTGVQARWAWVRAELGRDKQRAVNLPAGIVVLEVICREDGSKMDQILLTPNPDWKP